MGRLLYGLDPAPFIPSWTDARSFLRMLSAELAVISVHQLGERMEVGTNRKARQGFPWRPFS